MHNRLLQLAVSLTIAFKLSAALAVPSPGDACLAKAQAVLAALDAGDYERARADFDTRMQTGLKAEQLKGMWGSLPDLVGPRKALATPTVTPSESGQVVVIGLGLRQPDLVGCLEDRAQPVGGGLVGPHQPEPVE